MDDEVTSPKLEDIEEGLARNYGEFDGLREEWGREWQRALVRRAKRRAKERTEAQKQSDTQLPLDAA